MNYQEQKNSEYQERYLAHQKRKKESLSGKYEKEIFYTPQQKKTFETILKNRHSSRVFSGEKITPKEYEKIVELCKLVPSSCDRRGVFILPVEDRDKKDLLSGILVGGVGWIHRADKVLLLVADMLAYGSPFEKEFMPYLDAGVMIQQVYLACEIQGLKCCFVNPNIREMNKKFFTDKYLTSETYKFCGAIAIGK